MYAEKIDISAKYFNGESIPSANTILKARLEYISQQSQDLVNNSLGVIQDQTDVNGLLKRAFLDFFGKELRNQKLLLEPQLEKDMLDHYRGYAFVGIKK